MWLAPSVGKYGGIQAEMAKQWMEHTHISFQQSYNLTYEAVHCNSNSWDPFVVKDIYSFNPSYLQHWEQVLRIYQEKVPKKIYGIHDEFYIGGTAIENIVRDIDSYISPYIQLHLLRWTLTCTIDWFHACIKTYIVIAIIYLVSNAVSTVEKVDRASQKALATTAISFKLWYSYWYSGNHDAVHVHTPRDWHICQEIPQSAMFSGNCWTIWDVFFAPSGHNSEWLSAWDFENGWCRHLSLTQDISSSDEESSATRCKKCTWGRGRWWPVSHQSDTHLDTVGEGNGK